MTAPLAPTLLRVVDDLVPELIAFRRDLHAHPELAFAEHRTTEKIRERILAAGLAPTDVGATGLVVDLGADLGDGAGDLVADDDGVRHVAPLAAGGVDVAVADAGELDVDQDVVVAQVAPLERDRLEGTICLGDRKRGS